MIEEGGAEMNTVILSHDHKRIVRKIRLRAAKIHVLGILLLIVVLAVPYLFKLERDLAVEAYKVAKSEFYAVVAKQEILKILRTKPISIGQALDMADIILSQKSVPVPMVLAIMEVESNFDPNAVSKKGAKGLLQVMPLTAKTYAGNLHTSIHDPIINIRASVDYLGELQRIYGEDWAKILRSYNGGPKKHYRGRNHDYRLAW
jgi:soluble lytic murein transglycosylase-like protein